MPNFSRSRSYCSTHTLMWASCSSRSRFCVSSSVCAAAAPWTSSARKRRRFDDWRAGLRSFQYITTLFHQPAQEGIVGPHDLEGLEMRVIDVDSHAEPASNWLDDFPSLKAKLPERFPDTDPRFRIGSSEMFAFFV